MASRRMSTGMQSARLGLAPGGKRGRVLPGAALLLLGILTVQLLVTPGMSNAVAARTFGDAPVTLGARNTIRGSRTAGLRVHVPTSSSVSLRFLEPNPDIAVTSKGRLAGILLTRDDVDNDRRPTLWAIKTTFCSKPNCEANAFHVAMSRGSGFVEGDLGAIPPGDYNLYLIADDSPVRVVLRLHGLQGTVTLRPGERVHSEMDVAPRHIYLDGAKNLYSDGQVVEADGESLWVFGSYRIRGRASNGGKFSRCFYRGEPPPTPVGFAPGCPGGFESSAVITRIGAPSGAFDHVHHGGALMSPGGTWGFGQNYVTTGLIDSIENVAVYVDLQQL